MTDLEYVRTQLRESKGQWLRISRETGVSHRAIYNVVRELNDPRSSTVNAMAEWFRRRAAQDTGADRAPESAPEKAAA